MIISHKHKFIFVKTKKTAGTSIEVFLSQHCGDRDVITPISPPVEPHAPQNYSGRFNPLPELALKLQQGRSIKPTLTDFRDRKKFYNHLPAQFIRARIPQKVWETYFKFCVERNPWDKTLSYYHMHRHDSGGTLTFEEYLKQGDWCLNYPFYTDSRGETILVDRVLHYENLTEELGEVFDRLGIPFDGSLNVRAKGDRRSDRRPYQDVFTADQRQLIETVFQKEIQMHGYQY